MELISKTVAWTICFLLFLQANPISGGEIRKHQNSAFSVGEKFTFEVKYGFVSAGLAIISIPGIKKIAGRDCYEISFRVSSHPAFDPFYRVRDNYSTLLDVSGIFPWKFEQHIREGKYSRDFSAFFDQRKLVAVTSQGSYGIPPYVHDIVSAFYYFRTLDLSKLKTGSIVHLTNFYNDRVYNLDVLVQGREKVKVKAGTFRCIAIEPLVKEGGLFKSEGSIMIWLTDDERKMPVKVKAKVIIGSIEGELIDYRF